MTLGCGGLMVVNGLQVKPLTRALGAEISGVDLGEPLSPEVADLIYEALLDRLVICFRNQTISPAQHLGFAESFGTLDAPHPVYAHVPGFDRIVMLENDASRPPDTDGWHADLTFKDNPPFASVLVARDVPDLGGDTLWASMYAAYEALPAEIKTYLAPLKAVHDMGDFRNDFTVAQENGSRLNEGMQQFGCAIHDVVRTHPVTKRKLLFVNDGFTVHIVGKTARESRRLLDYLLDHINRPEFQMRLNWRKDSLVMWDNRCTQHYAVSDYLPAYRCMHRITVVNDRRVT